MQEWFRASFAKPTAAQDKGWAAIAKGESTLLLAPTGSGKTLAAFLWCLNRLMFGPPPDGKRRTRVLYVSPLKALAVDVERNLRAPLVGIAHAAQRLGVAAYSPEVWVRTGDTPAAERARFLRAPADIVITTPESLFLLLTSQSRDAFATLDTVILDEIHALVPTKRGSHLALSLERLEKLANRPLQRIGLSATQRPLDEVARFLGGADTSVASAAKKAKTPKVGKRSAAAGIHAEFAGAVRKVHYRPVTVVDSGTRKELKLRIEVPVEDMAKLADPIDIPSGPASQGPVRPSIWSAIHPRLVELVRAHRSTLIFVNSRRVAERLAGALNELAEEPLVRAHHGSLARPQRIEIEEALKAGKLRGLVATSSLELGIDMGAIDLVIQIEAPPSVASGLQRIGRGGHHVDAVSEGLIFPKYRGDLVASAAVARSMHRGEVEAIRYPRNPLDVLAQQVVAAVAMDPWDQDELFALVRGAAPYADLDRSVFDGVLDMLAGRYPSDEFAELRPRLTWDRVKGTLVTREGARRVAIANAGTIPDRGLYSVFLAGAAPGTARVGELDEEMVFETHPGETFVLGASTWRIEEIGHDRVTVSPAPGEPGRMPFWKGDAPGRPLEFGRAIGALVRTLRAMPRAAALDRLVREHDLDRQAAENLLQYLADQHEAVGHVPDDRTIVIERCRDELGDWRVCLLSPFGGKVLAPWSMAILARIHDQAGLDVETLWTNDGLVVRFPDTDEAPDPQLMLPAAADAEAMIVRQLGATSLFAAKFREAAARALLLPRRRVGTRTPLWQQRKRAADLLAVAAKFGSFPMLLEAHRECLRDLFDVPALLETLRAIERREIRVVTVDSTQPSPFAASLLFGYVAAYLYDGDAPLAERRAQALSIDHAQLRALIGEAELRAVLDGDAIDSVERELQHLEPQRRFKTADGLHDLLLRIGDLAPEEIAQRAAVEAWEPLVARLREERRVLTLAVAGEERVVAVEDAARFRDALGTPLPQGLPGALLATARDPLRDLVLRYARTHGPFVTQDVALRFGLARPAVETALARAAAGGRILEGEFRPGGTQREWCDSSVLSQIRRRSLARLRHEVEPVEAAVLGRFFTSWQGVLRPRRGLDALLDAIETLQGVPLIASALEREILPARIAGYERRDLDTLLAAGEVLWCGVEPLGDADGRVALYLTDQFPRLWRPQPPPGHGAAPRKQAGEATLSQREAAVVAHLQKEGASFFAAVHEAAGGGYPRDSLDAIWNLVWRGLLTNDSLQPLRAFLGSRTARSGRRTAPGSAMARAFRSRRQTPSAAEGRWSLLAPRLRPLSATAWSAALAQQLLQRYGLVARETPAAEQVYGGFSAVYDVLKTMEESGRVRRGLFVSGVGALQFALPQALDLLRSLRTPPEVLEVVVLAASDPANPYGTVLRWPAAAAARTPSRAAGARVLLVNGAAAAYLGKGGKQLLTWLPEDDPDRAPMARAIARALAEDSQRHAALYAEIDALAAAEHPLAPFLVDAGFVRTHQGLQLGQRRALEIAAAAGAAAAGAAPIGAATTGAAGSEADLPGADA